MTLRHVDGQAVWYGCGSDAVSLDTAARLIRETGVQRLVWVDVFDAELSAFLCNFGVTAYRPGSTRLPAVGDGIQELVLASSLASAYDFAISRCM